jgi:hypothetical protein
VPEERKPIPGVTADELASIAKPTVIWRSSPLDRYHTEETSMRVHGLIPGSGSSSHRGVTTSGHASRFSPLKARATSSTRAPSWQILEYSKTI